MKKYLVIFILLFAASKVVVAQNPYGYTLPYLMYKIDSTVGNNSVTSNLKIDSIASAESPNGIKYQYSIQVNGLTINKATMYLNDVNQVIISNGNNFFVEVNLLKKIIQNQFSFNLSSLSNYIITNNIDADFIAYNYSTISNLASVHNIFPADSTAYWLITTKPANNFFDLIRINPSNGEIDEIKKTKRF
jgi:hypothetical protein